jgi:polysaccharide pyruvyl transferase WcaK-like protein
MRIAFSHWYSDENLGDVAIALAQLEMLAAHDPRPEVVVLAAESEASLPDSFSGYVGGLVCNPWGAPGAVGKLRWLLQVGGATLSILAPRSPLLPASFRRFVAEVDRSDALMPKGGGYLYALRGVRGVFFTTRIVWPLLLARRLGVRRILWGHSIGPAESKLGSAILRLALRGAEIVVRDSKSAELLESWDAPHVRKPDIALKWGASQPGPPNVLRTVKRIGITARTVSSSQTDQRRYESAVIEAVNSIGRQAADEGLCVEVALLPQVTGPTVLEDDRVVLHRIGAALSLPVSWVDLRLPRLEDILDAYASLEFLLATRLHSAILASCVRTPFMVFEYIGGKAQGVVDDLGLPSWTLVDDASRLPASALKSWTRRDDIRRLIEAAQPRIAAELSDLDTFLARQVV